MTNVFIVIPGILLLFGVLYYEKRKDRIPLLMIKPALSLLFVITALLQPRLVPGYYHYLFVGLVFCLIGDVCLALPQKKAFMGGLVAFLIGHVFYVFSFLSLIAISDWTSTGLVIIFGMSTIVFFWLRPYLSSMLIPVLLYILVITVMVSGAWAPLIFLWLDILLASMGIQEKILVKNTEERLAGLAVVAASEQALHLCRVVG